MAKYRNSPTRFTEIPPNIAAVFENPVWQTLAAQEGAYNDPAAVTTGDILRMRLLSEIRPSQLKH